MGRLRRRAAPPPSVSWVVGGQAESPDQSIWNGHPPYQERPQPTSSLRPHPSQADQVRPAAQIATQGPRCRQAREPERSNQGPRSKKAELADQAAMPKMPTEPRQSPGSFPKRARLRSQGMSRNRRFAVGAEPHTNSPSGVHGNGLLGGGLRLPRNSISARISLWRTPIPP